jgi:hypothetical protein
MLDPCKNYGRKKLNHAKILPAIASVTAKSVGGI